MIKEWATVVSWHNGVAQVHCDVKASLPQLRAPICRLVAGVLSKLGAADQPYRPSVPCERAVGRGARGGLGSLKAACWAQRCWCIWRRWRGCLYGVYFSGAVCQRYCVTLRRAAGRRRRLPGGARSVAATGGTSVLAAGDFERRTAAGSAAC